MVLELAIALSLGGVLAAPAAPMDGGVPLQDEAVDERAVLLAKDWPTCAPGAGLQKACWGMTRDEVSAAYGGYADDTHHPGGKTFASGDRLLIESLKIGDHDYVGGCDFIDGKLVQVSAETSWDGRPELALERFDELRKALTEKYGKPKNLTHGRAPNRESALRLGTAWFESRWTTGNTDVDLVATQNSDHAFNYQVVLIYGEKGAEAKLKKQADRKAAAAKDAAKKDL